MKKFRNEKNKLARRRTATRCPNDAVTIRQRNKNSKNLHKFVDTNDNKQATEEFV